MYCATCGGSLRVMCDCPQRTCNAQSNPDSEGVVHYCERQLHHRGRCAKARPDMGANCLMAWQESGAQLYEDLNMQLPAGITYKDEN